MDLQAVIFDMDGVLIDSWDAHKESWRISAEARGLSCDADTFARLYGHGFYVWVKELGGEHLSPTEVQRWYEEKEALYREIFTREPHIMEGVEDLQQALHDAGVRMAVGSAGPRSNVDMAVGLLRTGPLLGATVSADDVQRPKPAPDVFLEAARRLGVDPACCVVIEDSLHGLQAAKDAGMLRVGLAGTEPLDVLSGHADLAVDSHRELNPQVLRTIDAKQA